jgi:alpha-L-fucosidase
MTSTTRLAHIVYDAGKHVVNSGIFMTKYHPKEERKPTMTNWDKITGNEAVQLAERGKVARPGTFSAVALKWRGTYKENDRLHYAECRWGGSEQGDVGNPCWNTMDSTIINLSKEYSEGVRNGDVWCGAEGDVSIRPGWFWHENQNASVKSPQKLMDIYLSSVGRGANLILNLPPDRRGLIHENDVASITEYGEHLRKTFETNLAKGAKLTASNTRGKDPSYGPERLLDDDIWSAWITDDDVNKPEVVLDLKGEKTFNLLRLREDIRLGQRIEGVAVDAWVNDAWKEIATAPCVGAIRLCRVPKTTTTKVRIRVTKSPVCPALSDLGLFLEPEFATWVPPLDCRDPKDKAKDKWKIVSASRGKAKAAIDGNPDTFWDTYDGTHSVPEQFVVDMGEEKTLKGFIYLPRQDRWLHGMVDQYAFQVSTDGENWTTASEGEFGNLRANPVEQSVSFPQVKTRYFKFIAKHAVEMKHATVAEIGVVETK